MSLEPRCNAAGDSSTPSTLVTVLCSGSNISVLIHEPSPQPKSTTLWQPCSFTICSRHHQPCESAVDTYADADKLAPQDALDSWIILLLGSWLIPLKICLRWALHDGTLNSWRDSRGCTSPRRKLFHTRKNNRKGGDSTCRARACRCEERLGVKTVGVPARHGCLTAALILISTGHRDSKPVGSCPRNGSRACNRTVAPGFICCNASCTGTRRVRQ